MLQNFSQQASPQLITLRPRSSSLLEDHEKLFAYRRRDSGSELLVICNFSAGCTENPLAAETAEGELLVCSYESAGQPSVLRPYEARMYLKTRDLGKDEANE